MLIGLACFSSCKKDEDQGGTATKTMAGEWFLHYSVDGGKTYTSKYYHFSTYNTAANTSSTMWLDDLKTFWQMKGKVSIDLANKTFSATDVANTYYDSSFTITDGKIMDNVAKASGSKTLTDSIYFKATFSDEVGTEYILAGYRKTGFLEDEH